MQPDTDVAKQLVEYWRDLPPGYRKAEIEQELRELAEIVNTTIRQYRSRAHDSATRD